VDNLKSYQVNPEVTFQRLGEETVLVHLGTGRIHHTNATGSRIWELLEEGRSVPEMLDILSSEFDVPADRLRGEVATFVEKLASEQMIQAAGKPH
jgi:hypothetical protein